jgi:hypothetical protein
LLIKNAPVRLTPGQRFQASRPEFLHPPPFSGLLMPALFTRALRPVHAEHGPDDRLHARIVAEVQFNNPPRN